MLNRQKGDRAGRKNLLAEGTLRAREGTWVLTDERELEDSWALWYRCGIIQVLGDPQCEIFLKTAGFCKASVLREVLVRLPLGLTQPPQAITEMGLQIGLMLRSFVLVHS